MRHDGPAPVAPTPIPLAPAAPVAASALWLLLLGVGLCWVLQGCGSSSAPGSPPPFVLETTTLPTAVEGLVYDEPVACAGGTPPYAWRIADGDLPAWAVLTQDGGNTMQVSGTPAEGDIGSSTFTIEVEDGTRLQAQREFQLVVSTELRIMTTVLPYAYAKEPYENYPYEEGMVLCCGGRPPYSWRVLDEQLPAWATAPAGTGDVVFITGTPEVTDEASTVFTIEVRDGDGQTDTQELELTVTTDLPDDYWSYMNLPDMTQDERRTFYDKTPEEWEAYYEATDAKALDLSNKLREHILAWYHDGADPRIPNDILPPSIHNAKTKGWTLQRPEEVDPARQWYVIPHHEVDHANCCMHSPEPYCTYLKLLYVAPFDSDLLVEGDFPYCRFMNYQILQPFAPPFPASGNRGQMEVPIVDVDIEPDDGHVNPFRVGSDRNATDRGYHLTFQLEAGNSVALNPVLQDWPVYRAAGNTRIGGPFGSAGPFGGGVLTSAVLWVRYYAMDKGQDELGGVALPKVLMRLDTGETFWIACDYSLAEERQTTRWPLAGSLPMEPPDYLGPSLGWFKVFDLYQIRMEAEGYRNCPPWSDAWDLDDTRNFIRTEMAGLFRRGAQCPPPGCFEQGATTLSYVSYLSRPFVLGPGKVYAITGTLPTTPRTRDGESSMTPAQARYWSLDHYVRCDDAGRRGICTGRLMDDEIVLDEENKFIIVFSRSWNRPSNATEENGVTWREWGPAASGSLTVRWVSVYPDHYDTLHNPHEPNLPWALTAWSQDTYDAGMVGRNEPGLLGPYHPVIHYMTKGEFEALGSDIDPDGLPIWEDD